MKILFYPPNTKNNIVIKYFWECLEKAGNDVLPLKKNIGYILFKKYDAVYLQWYENLPSKRLKTLLMLCIKILLVYIFKIKGVEIFFVMHNKISHDKDVAKYSNFILRFILRHADKILILSRVSVIDISRILGKKYFTANNINRKIFYIPHPNYIDAYPNTTHIYYNKIQDKIKDKFVILNMGMVRPYKNLELLIKVFKSANLGNSLLIIAGKPESKQYEAKLKNLIGGDDNILFIPEFIKDENLSEVVNSSNIMVFPYNKESALNSGAIYLACSYARSFIAPPMGTVYELEPVKDDFYIYDYESVSEHFSQLKKSLIEAHADWEDDKIKFAKKGKELKDFVERNNSLEKLIEQYKKIS